MTYSIPLPKAEHRRAFWQWLRQFSILAALLVMIGLAIGWCLPYPWGAPKLSAKLDHLEQHSDAYNTFFIGSSYTYRHVSPKIFDREIKTLTDDPSRHTRSFNLGVDGMHQPATGRLLRHLLDLDLPNMKTVVLELGRFTSAVDPGIDHTPEAQYWRTPRLTASMIRFLWNRPDKGFGQKVFQTGRLLAIQVEASLNIGHGPRIIDYLLDKGSTDHHRHFLGPDNDGFYAVDRQAIDLTGESLTSDLLEHPEAEKVLERMRSRATDAFTRPLDPVNPEGLVILRALTAEAEEAGVDLYFLVPPRMTSRYRHLRPLFEHLPAERLIWQMADPRQAPEFYRLDESADRGHMNGAGAERYTRRLARWIVDGGASEAQ